MQHNQHAAHNSEENQYLRLALMIALSYVSMYLLALLIAGETWNVSSLVGLIGLFGIAVQNSLVLVTQTRGLLAEGRDLPEAVREASIGRVRPKLMTAGTATLGLLPMLVLRLHGHRD